MRLATFADIHAAVRPYWFGVAARHRYGLEHMHTLMEYLGNPQDRLRVVHVAGTSGKTSTAYYAAALLRAAGKKVGLTVSPHVDEVNERVQINLTPLAEPMFAERFGEYLELVQASGVTPNYSELFVAFALWEFAAQGVDYAVVEVGVGGLLDSTNVTTREDKVCIITDIGFDHMHLLGAILPEIAAQKAGIIQLHNAVFCYDQAAEVTEVIRRQAAIKQADLHVLTAVPGAVLYSFLPLFQLRNFGLAYSAFQYIAERDGLPMLAPAAVAAAARTVIPARMEVYELHGKTLIIDAAHNEQKFQGLCKSVRARYGKQPIAALVRLGIENDDARMVGSCAVLAENVQHTIITKAVDDDDPERVAAVCSAAGCESIEVIADPQAAFTALLGRSEPIVIVAGSFLLLNHIRPLVAAATKGEDALK